jgi:hypothetical protein
MMVKVAVVLFGLSSGSAYADERWDHIIDLGQTPRYHACRAEADKYSFTIRDSP